MILGGGRCQAVMVMCVCEPCAGYCENWETRKHVSLCFHCSFAGLVSVLIRGLSTHLHHMPTVPLDLPGVEWGPAASDPVSGTFGLSASCWPIESMNGELLCMTAWFLSPPPGSRSATWWSFPPGFLSFPSSCCPFCRHPHVCSLC